MINLDQRYLEYLKGHKKLRIDGLEETVKAYGWSCDGNDIIGCLLYTSPSPRDATLSRMPSSA